MATSKNGLKTLWVPGKNPNKKGKIETTKKPVNYNKTQKKNEQWTLGGPKSIETLMICDAQLEVLNGVIPSTSKNNSHSYIDKNNCSIENNLKNDKTNFDETNEICSCSIEETDAKEVLPDCENENSKNERYEKLVTCLYYTINLCECSIS
ncbi:uncharacterized protein LOC129606253 [Condylostylus longicornis]|uniref:uncharacterized protein LOC129606253 n=1 Tax=Condylostylus longicornis TaxID=2530218 RepID=UPI00244E41C1|nr:uncharacterized protein LOC129606253 [Condylostylus longicornis]XP_055372439.1 uncharacterized protein LOC129606253 [Condylostylus longicornis]